MKFIKKMVWMVLFASILALPVWADGPARIERTTVNGMPILLQRTNSDLVEVTMLLKSGSGLDGKKKGTAELMNTLVYLKLLGAPESLGTVNVLTRPDYTEIRIQASAENLKKVLVELENLLTSPLYSYDVIMDLKQFLIADIKGMPAFNKTYFEANRNFYGPAHPYNDFLEPEVVESITGHDVYRWYRQTYQPGNAILSIAGGVKESMDQIAKIFGEMLYESVDQRLLIRPIIPKQNRQIEREDYNGRVASICMEFAAPRLQDPEYPAFRIIAYYLENYQYYFEKLRIEEGLMYTGMVYYSYLERPQAPNIVFLTMTDPEDLFLIEAKTLDITRELMEKGIEQSIINQIAEAIEKDGKSKIQSGIGASRRNVMSYYLQNQLVYDENLWPKLKQVTTADIQKAAAKYLNHYVRVAYIPKEKPDSF
ncbi:MAG TPA: insulinase family protein [Bacillota bacterium]|nr:insulinase family protein [Bacillota bacterium]